MSIDVNKVNPRKLRALGTRILCHRENVPMRGGIAVPQTSAESWRWTVISIGKDVKLDLKIGDEIMASGVLNVDYAPLPGSQDLFIIAEAAVNIVIGDPEYTKAPPKNAYEMLQDLS